MAEHRPNIIIIRCCLEFLHWIVLNDIASMPEVTAVIDFLAPIRATPRRIMDDSLLTHHSQHQERMKESRKQRRKEMHRMLLLAASNCYCYYCYYLYY